MSIAYRCLQAFWKWAVSEDEVRESPMARMTPPIVPEEPPPILRPEQIKAILDACAGTDFEARRDTALVRMLLDTGMRRGEISGLRLADVDLDESVAIVLGKGRRPRACPFGAKTAQAIDRYLRSRASHPQAQRDELWLGDPRRPHRQRRPPGAAAPRHGGGPAPSSTLTSSGTRTRTCGSPTAAPRATSCAWPAGRAARCLADTGHRQPTRGNARRTGSGVRGIGS